MILKKYIRTIITFSLGLAVGGVLSAEIRKLSAPLIIALRNKSTDPVSLCEKGSSTGPKQYTCTPLTKKLFRLRPITIPVIPYNRYREEFITGEPLFPQEALHITTSRGKFAVWRDETGVMCSLEFTPGKFREECVPVNLLKNIELNPDKHALMRSIMLLLIKRHLLPILS